MQKRPKTMNSWYSNEIITYLPPYTMKVRFRDEGHAEEARIRDQTTVEQVWNISRCTIACLFTLNCLKCGADFHYTVHIPYIPAWECWITECSGTGMRRAESLEREGNKTEAEGNNLHLLPHGLWAPVQQTHDLITRNVASWEFYCIRDKYILGLGKNARLMSAHPPPSCYSSRHLFHEALPRITWDNVQEVASAAQALSCSEASVKLSPLANMFVAVCSWQVELRTNKILCPNIGTENSEKESFRTNFLMFQYI